jgi:hypothetical protein
MRSLRIICPNGHLGFAPIRVESFRSGVDAGRTSSRPIPAATTSGRSARHRHVDEPARLAGPRPRAHAARLAQARRADDHRLGGIRARTVASTSTSDHQGARGEAPAAAFKLGYFYSEIGKEELRRRMRAGDTVAGLEGYDALTEAELDATERIVAMAGVHPFIKLLDAGADVIIGGRSSDSCVFAAPAIHRGFAEADAYYLGKVLECASFCAEPYGGKEPVLGEITADAVLVTGDAIRTSAVPSRPSPGTRCTSAPTPISSRSRGGTLDMSQCRYEQVAPKPRASPAPGSSVPASFA